MFKNYKIKIMKLEDMEIYNISMEIGDEIWFSVVEWENLAKFSIGQQIVRSADSIAANIAEGFGRSSMADKLHFYVMARGSLTELQNQIILLSDVGLIKDNEYKELLSQAQITHKLIVGLIKTTQKRQS